MVHDRGEDPDATVPDARARRSTDDDATRSIHPSDADATRRITPPDADATQVSQPADATRVSGAAADATQVSGAAADATRVSGAAAQPADATRVSGTADQPAPRWAARANVPPPGATPRRPVPQSWDDETGPVEDPYGGRSWFTPVIVGIVALVLVAALGFGVWLIYRATANEPGTGPTDVVSSEPASPAPPTSAPPSPSASPPPSPSAPAGVPIPALRGETEQSATAALTALGLTVTVERRSDPLVEPGRVIDTDPPAGTAVPAGSTVTLIVASAPSPSPSPSRSTRSASPSPVAS